MFSIGTSLWAGPLLEHKPKKQAPSGHAHVENVDLPNGYVLRRDVPIMLGDDPPFLEGPIRETPG